jgi:hypothetical protein
MQLQIEPINVCNADCVFCPYGQMKRLKGTMPMDLFSKIIDEAATISRIDHYTLTGLGETLLDPHLVDRIWYIRSKNKTALVDIYTNGSSLTEQKAVALRDAGLSVLYVSLNAVRAEQRKQIMRLNDFDRVVRALDAAISIASPMKVIVKAVIAKDLMESGDTDEFIERWGGKSDEGGNAFIHLEGNWAGAMYPMRVKPTKACNRALDEIMVMQDGRVSLCCFDGEGDVVLGDLKHQTIREVFAGEKAVGIRQAHVEGRRGELQLCGTCTAI